jgi:hypothetical protein
VRGWHDETVTIAPPRSGLRRPPECCGVRRRACRPQYRRHGVTPCVRSGAAVLGLCRHRGGLPRTARHGRRPRYRLAADRAHRGAVWSRWRHIDWITRRLSAVHTTNASKWTVFAEAARHERCHHGAVGGRVSAVLGSRRLRRIEFDDIAAGAAAGVSGGRACGGCEAVRDAVRMFGRAFATRFAPATFVVATLVATAVGLLLVGGGR